MIIIKIIIISIIHSKEFFGQVLFAKYCTCYKLSTTLLGGYHFTNDTQKGKCVAHYHTDSKGNDDKYMSLIKNFPTIILTTNWNYNAVFIVQAYKNGIWRTLRIWSETHSCITENLNFLWIVLNSRTAPAVFKTVSASSC